VKRRRPPLNGPGGLAFDAGGDLWVSTAGNTVVEFTTSQQATGSPTPAVTISAVSGSLAGPAALAFDLGGNLWVANNQSNTLVEYTTAQLVAGGAVAPVVTVSATGSSVVQPTAILFDPHATNLPLH
jgi:sugar lactone lactonase YvrE